MYEFIKRGAETVYIRAITKPGNGNNLEKGVDALASHFEISKQQARGLASECHDAYTNHRDWRKKQNLSPVL